MELWAVRCVELVATIRRARGDHADRRRRRLHRADLHGGSVGSQKSAIGQIKRVLFVAGRMIRRRVQSIEAVPLRFDIWPLGESKTHSSKNLDSALMHLMKRMQRTNVMRRSRKRDVYARERVGFFFSADFFAALVKLRGNRVARLVEQSTYDRTFLFAERFHPLAPFGDAAAF